MNRYPPTPADGAAATLRRRLADAVVAETRGLVELAGQGAWNEVPSRLVRRRASLVALERELRGAGPSALAESAGTLAALRAAVLESERLMAWMLPRGPGRPH
jgi:hypothetical protein